MIKSPFFDKERPINVGLVGCGRIAKNHVAAIQHYENDLVLKAVCDIDTEKMHADFLPEDIQRYQHYEALLADQKIDMVILCTPSGLHPAQAIAASRHNKHVLTEKPMATSWQDGLNMVKACEDAQVKLFVVKQNRCNPTVQAVKEAIEQGYFGRIYMVSSNVFWTRPQEYYDQGAWRGTWALDGGALMNQASHYIDLLTWLIGPVESVHAMTATLARDIEAEDTAVINLRWKDGTLGGMNVTMLTYPKNLEGSITIMGEKGTVRLGGVALNKITDWQFAKNPLQLADIEAVNYAPTSVYGQGHVNYYANVIKTLRGQPAPVTDGYAGLHSLELLIAAYQSAQQGETVKLPLTR